MSAHRNRFRMIGSAAIAVLTACAWLGLAGQAQAQEKAALPTLGTIERLDPRFDKLVPADARVERIAEGFDWSEGPVWDRARKVPALLRRPDEHRLQVAGRQGRQRLPQAERLHRLGPARRRAGLERPAHGPRGPARPLPARRPPRRPPRVGQDASRPWPTSTRASGSTAPTTASSSRTATSTSPTRPTACSS